MYSMLAQTNPQVFGWEHLTFLAVFIVFMIASLLLVKFFAKNEKVQDIVVRCAGVLLLIFIMWNRIAICISHQRATYLIPDSFCGMSSLVLALAVTFGRRNNNVLHFVFYFAILGNVLSMFYPDFIGQASSIFYSNTISGLLHHSFGFLVCVLLCMVGWFKPNYKKSGNIVIGFMAYITIGAFMMSVFDYSDAFYINNPILSGTPLTVWVLIPIFVALYTLFMVSYGLIRRKLQKRNDSFTKIKKVLNEKF